MKLFKKAKDGGPESTVTGYWLIEAKRLFSIVLLRFDDGSRDSYHSHAFDSLNWMLSGRVREFFFKEPVTQHMMEQDREYGPSILPILTRRSRFHKVMSIGTTWVLSIRGPWTKTWDEYDPKTGKFSVLGHGRKPL